MTLLCPCAFCLNAKALTFQRNEKSDNRSEVISQTQKGLSPSSCTGDGEQIHAQEHIDNTTRVIPQSCVAAARPSSQVPQ